MPTIKATCPRCGEVELTPADIDLRVDAMDAHASTYAFECPGCGLEVRKPADSRVVRLLESGGVVVRNAEPRPAPHPEAFAPGDPRWGRAPITHDDLLDFHALVADEQAFRAALDAVVATSTPRG